MRFHLIRLLTSIAALIVVALLALPAQAAGLLRDADMEHALKQIAAPILKAAGLSPERVKILVVDDSTLNAFVISNDAIFVHAGLINRLESAVMLQGVIAHEAAHIANGHIVRRLGNLDNARTISGLGLALAAAAASARPSPLMVRALSRLPRRRTIWPLAICAASWAITPCSITADSSLLIRPACTNIASLLMTKAFSVLSSTTRIFTRSGDRPAALRMGAAICFSACSISASRNRPAACAGRASRATTIRAAIDVRRRIR